MKRGACNSMLWAAPQLPISAAALPSQRACRRALHTPLTLLSMFTSCCSPPTRPDLSYEEVLNVSVACANMPSVLPDPHRLSLCASKLTLNRHNTTPTGD